jgi:hypothetical protein
LIGEFPGEEEIKQGLPFRPSRNPWAISAGDILREELGRITPWSFDDVRVGNLWLHKKDEECDFDWHLAQTKQEIRRRRFVFVMGSEFGGVLYEGTETDNLGLEIALPYKARGIVAPNPAQLSKEGNGVGEFREALRKFVAMTEGR